MARYFQAQFRLAEWRRLSAWREDFRALPRPDFAATAAALGCVAGGDRVAAVRAALAGSTVTQKVASKWTGDVVCPRCRDAPETRWQRFWECPVTRPVWMCRGFLPAEPLGPGQEALWGVVPADASLDAQAEEVGREAWPPSCGLPDIVYADGSAYDGNDPSLACAAWAVVWRERGGGAG